MHSTLKGNSGATILNTKILLPLKRSLTLPEAGGTSSPTGRLPDVALDPVVSLNEATAAAVAAVRFNATA